MVERYKKILLDLDGPLLDGKERHYNCYRSILEKYGYRPIGIDEYWGKKRARGNRRNLLKISGADEIYDNFLASWLELIESPEMLAYDKIQEGAIDCLRDWKCQGREIILITMRKNKKTLDEQLKLHGLRQFLDDVLVCNYANGGYGKAMAVRAKYTTKQLWREALWIGDTEADWEAAKSLGCDIVLISNGLRNEQCLRSLEGALIKPSIALLKGAS